MNPAARAAFASRLEDFSDSIPASLVRRFQQITERKEGGTVKVKVGGGPRLTCSVDLLKLADGQDGVIVAELGEDSERQTPPPSISARPVKRPRKVAGKSPAAAKRRALPKAPPALTTEEMRAFKAVGRKVLRLCKDKEPSKEIAPEAAPAVSANYPVPSEQQARALMDVLAAFDLVLFLSDGLEIVDMRGRPARLGWRKASLPGKSVADLLSPYDRAAFRRMLNKGSPACKRTTVVAAEKGAATPCCALFGRWPEGNAAYFLAFISLELPPRMKRPQAGSTLARLAA